MFPGAVALWPTLAAAAVILAAQQGGRFGVHRLLASRPLRMLGDISYGLYLWHWPVLVIALRWRERDRAGWLLGGAAILVALVLAYLTTRFVDAPWRAWRWPELRVRNGFAGVAACVAVALVPIAAVQGTVATTAGQAEARAAVDNPGAEALDPGYTDQASPTASLLPLPQNLPNDWYALPKACSSDLNLPTALAGSCGMTAVAANEAKTIVVVGDSHAEQWMAALEPVAQEHGIRVVSLLRAAASTSRAWRRGTPAATRSTPRWRLTSRPTLPVRSSWSAPRPRRRHQPRPSRRASTPRSLP